MKLLATNVASRQQVKWTKSHFQSVTIVFYYCFTERHLHNCSASSSWEAAQPILVRRRRTLTDQPLVFMWETAQKHLQQPDACERRRWGRTGMKHSHSTERKTKHQAKTSSFSLYIEHQAPSESPGRYGRRKWEKRMVQQQARVCVCVWEGGWTLPLQEPKEAKGSKLTLCPDRTGEQLQVRLPRPLLAASDHCDNLLSGNLIGFFFPSTQIFFFFFCLTTKSLPANRTSSFFFSLLQKQTQKLDK